ncbi:MAG: DUF177 domain-containing protein [Bacteriovoracaceae bacterium]|nr:DUF177 domain-containing protein [Bacteriovoracaceae bacterium]
MKNPLENHLESNLNISKLPINATVTHSLDKSAPWVKAILVELNENASEKTPEEWILETDINIRIELTKKFKGEIGEYLLVKGTVDANYATECVRTLKTMKDSVHAEFNTCFAPEAVLQSEEYAETGEIWIDGETRDLYGYKKNHVELNEMIHEQIYMNYNTYPKLDADSPLDGTIDADKMRQ